MAFIGVRSSWLMRDRNSLLARLARLGRQRAARPTGTTTPGKGLRLALGIEQQADAMRGHGSRARRPGGSASGGRGT